MEYVSNFLMYNTLGLGISSIYFLSLEYMSDSSRFKENLKRYGNNVKYWILDKIVSGYSLYRDFYPKSQEIEDNTNEIKELIYDVSGNITSRNNKEYKWVFEKIFIDGKEFFVRDYLYNSNNSIKSNIIFMSCEIIDNKNTINITNEITRFCVSGIEIDKIFLKAFMKKIFDYELTEEFTMNFITTDCNILTIDKTTKLNIKDDSFDIIPYSQVNLHE